MPNRRLHPAPVPRPVPPGGGDPGAGCGSLAPWIPSRSGMEVRLATQVLPSPEGDRLHGHLDIRYEEALEDRGFQVLETLAWQRAQVLLKRHFSGAGCQARVSFAAGHPACLSLTLSMPVPSDPAARTLEAMVARIFLA